MVVRKERVSHERQLLARLRDVVSDIADAGISFSGQGVANRLSIPTWGLSSSQQFQYRDCYGSRHQPGPLSSKPRVAGGSPIS